MFAFTCFVDDGGYDYVDDYDVADVDYDGYGVNVYAFVLSLC